MKKLYEIPITFRILYQHSEYSSAGWPLVRIYFDDCLVSNFEANSDSIEFTVQQNYITNSTSKLVIEHYGKNYCTDDKFFAVDKMYINNIDLEHILWESTQYPLLPPWDNQSISEFYGNTYLGHNGKIVWVFNNPLLLDIQKRLGRTVKQMSGQDSTREVLESVKSFFFSQE